MNHRSLKTVVVVLAMCAWVGASTIKLTDGTTVEGDVKRVAEGWQVTSADGKVRIVPESAVASLQLSAPDHSDPRDATQRLASMRKTVEAMSDAALIIQRYKTLITQIGGTPSADDARKDLAMWEDRQAKGMVKVGKEWLASDAVKDLQQKNAQSVEQARDMIKQGHVKEATAVVDKVLAAEPGNVGALYLKGLISFRQDQIPQARRYFEQVLTAVPDHGPTLNNLAVVQSRQNAVPAAMVSLSRAMTATPMNTVIHDNVAELLNSATREARQSAPGKKLQAQFQQEEPKLQSEMEKAGWYRWGATWVTQDQLQQLRAVDAEVKAKLDALSKDFDDTQDSIAQIDASIQSNNRSMADIEARNYTYDDQGRLVRLPLPATWYDLKRDNDTLATKRQREIAKLDTLRKQAQEAKGKYPIAPYTQRPKMLDEQFMPAVVGSAAGQAPATAPATAPAEAGT